VRGGEATGRRVEQHWARLTSLEMIQALRGSLEALLAELRRHQTPAT
jgi:hypothetical protein